MLLLTLLLSIYPNLLHNSPQLKLSCENMNDGDKSWCYFHPTELVIGVCALCLNERLVILASKQRSHHLHHAKSFIRNKSSSFTHHNSHKTNSSTIPKIFAIGSLLNRLELRHRKTEDSGYSDTSTSHEDSFISMKFENNNGVGSWEKASAGTVSKVSLEQCNFSWSHSLVSSNEVTNYKGSTKTVVEHSKQPHGTAASLRWRKRIGHLFQLSRWKRSNKKGSVCHVGSKQMEGGVNGRNSGWIRSLTKRRTRE